MESKVPGRPRKYVHDEALGQAVDAFWQKGFDATSLGDLEAAMSMNRPSIYNAFGDKESVYLRALGQFSGRLKEAVGKRIAGEPGLENALTRAYLSALDVYFSTTPPRGCFMFCTAPVEALAHPEVQRQLMRALQELDGAFEVRFRKAQETGEYPPECDAKHAAQMAQAVLHSLAIRARAGESKLSLRRMAKFAAAQLCAVPGATS